MSTDVVNKHTTIDTGTCEKMLNGWSLGRITRIIYRRRCL